MINFLKNPIAFWRRYIPQDFKFSKGSLERAEKLANQGCLGLAQEYVKRKQIPQTPIPMDPETIFKTEFPDQLKINVFVFERYYPNGGMNDLIGTYTTMEAALADWPNHIKEEYFDGTIQMAHGSKIIKEFDYQTYKSRALNTEKSVYMNQLPGNPEDAKGVLIKMEIGYDGQIWENRKYYCDRWGGVFGYNTGTEHVVPIYKIDGDQDITPEMTLRYKNDYFVFYEIEDIYFSQVFIHGIKYIDSCKTKEEVNALAERAVKLFFDLPIKG